MDAHSEAILEEYRQYQYSYNKIKEIAVSSLKDFIVSLNMLVNSVEARVKTESSLTGKLNLKGFKYKTIRDITDIVGARVVTFYNDEIDKVAAKLTSTFTIDWNNSIDKRKIYKVDQFGYMSLHYICSIPKSIYFDENHPEINELKFEVQIRSVLQHTWATIYHDTGYKNDVEVPSIYLRKLNRLASILELADEQFMDIRTSLDDYRRRIKQIIKDGRLEEVEFNGDSYHTFVESGGFIELNKRIATINNMEIEKVSLRNFLAVFKMFNYETLKDFNNALKDNSEAAYQLCIRQFEGTDIDIITNATGPLALAMVIAVKNGCREDVLIKIMETIYGVRRSNKSYVKRILSICHDMGLIKEE